VIHAHYNSGGRASRETLKNRLKSSLSSKIASRKGGPPCVSWMRVDRHDTEAVTTSGLHEAHPKTGIYLESNIPSVVNLVIAGDFE